MKRTFLTALLSINVVSLTLAQQPAAAPTEPPLRLTSTAFADGGIIPVKFSQAAPNVAPGGGTSPALSWSDVPKGTQSFVVYMHDIDVTRNKTSEDNLHWLVWNIPGAATSLPEGLPTGAELKDGSYQANLLNAQYRGPGAPASGPLHHYVFEIYALDIKLDIKPGADGSGPATLQKILKAMEGHVLGKAGYVGLFKRPQ